MINPKKIIKMENLTDLIEELDNYIPKLENKNPEISESSVGWHIEHSLLAINNIVSALNDSDPDKYKWKFNPIRTLVLTMNKIPRGKGKAPEIVIPDNNITSKKLKTHIQNSFEKISVIDSLNPDNYFDHPFFGKLNLKPAKKFILIHTKHHLNIIKDILKK